MINSMIKNESTTLRLRGQKYYENCWVWYSLRRQCRHIKHINVDILCKKM